ncbi:hypothetical protein [Novosphingobium soli]|uniref:Alginate export domain-containing protein n=1 Tax=Novosphingobium soli TaxID=574956 RepID=A0ABV6CUN4_9SPHN
MKPWAALPVVGAAACALQAQAGEVKVKPVAEARVRYEHVEQDGLDLDADAVTVRVRGGAQASSGALSATVVAQGTLAVLGDYADGLGRDPARPLVADPQNVALYLAQIQYQARGVTLTAGRQKIALDDERFVGNIAFRDNAQTFDAVRAEIAPLRGVKLDLAYTWSVRTIWGIDGTGGRQQAVGGDTVLANLSWDTPLGKLTGFGYLVDQDEAAVQGFRLSSQTYGLRLAGTRALGPAAKLSYQASYARQSDWHRNPNDHRADYWLADATLDVKGWKLNAGYEVLGAGKGAAGGVPLTSFQMPLATNFKFQGWADKFLTTPPNGVRDLYLGGGYGAQRLGGLTAVTLQAMWHRFDSDRLDQRYGSEVDLLASARLHATTVALRYAHYEARALATDTDKVWLQLDWVI